MSEPLNTSLEAEFSKAKYWFDRIANAVGKLKENEIRLCRDEDDRAFVMLCEYLNPLNVHHVGEKSLESYVEPGQAMDNAFRFLEYLRSVKAASNETIAIVKGTLNSINDDKTKEFVRQIILKTYKMGATAATVNKAVGKTVIPVFGCMLANKFFDHPKTIDGKEIYITEKLDGIRAIAVCKNGVCNIFSRQGQPIEGLTEIEKELLQLSNPTYNIGWVFDGELLISDRNNIPSKEQYKLTTKIVRTKNAHKTGITYNVFDRIDYSSLCDGSCLVSYKLRREFLEFRFNNHNLKHVSLVPVKQILSKDMDYQRKFDTIVDLVTKAREAGEEGVMLNIADAPYVCKRTSNLLKVKVFKDCDLKIVGFQRGTGKFDGTLGALLVDYKGTTVGVGSGMTDDERIEFWKNQKKYIGRVVTVQYFEETNDADGNPSIRFPVFKELREEGKEVSYA